MAVFQEVGVPSNTIENAALDPAPQVGDVVDFGENGGLMVVKYRIISASTDVYVCQPLDDPRRLLSHR